MNNEKLYNDIDKLNELSIQSSQLSNAFFLTGNSLVSGELSKISYTISDCAKSIGDNYREAVHKNFHDTQESTNNTVKALLNACLLGDEK